MLRKYLRFACNSIDYIHEKLCDFLWTASHRFFERNEKIVRFQVQHNTFSIILCFMGKIDILYRQPFKIVIQDWSLTINRSVKNGRFLPHETIRTKRLFIYSYISPARKSLISHVVWRKESRVFTAKYQFHLNLQRVI